MRRADPTTLPSRAAWRDLPVLRVFDALGRERVLRLSAAIALVVGMVWVVGNAMPLSGDVTTWIHDAGNYYAAGERLNVGHSLYAYGPGDRHELELLFGLPSPYLYPPLIGVLFRPIASFLPYAPVVVAFWAAGMIAFLAFLGWLLYRGGTTIAVGILLLLVPLVETAWSGNVSTFITIAIILAWFALGSGHPRVAGAIIGLTSVLKLTPVFLAWWLLVTRRWDALTTAVVVGLVSLGVGVLGAGIGAHFEYLHISDAVARGGGIQGSLVGILTALGASPDLMPLVAPIVSVIGIVAIWALRKRERAAWVVAIATGVFASPIFNLTNVTLLLAAFVALDGRIGMGRGVGAAAAATERPFPAPAA
jgi:glycosyl transferase family 87